jgi:hypothetical protein
MFGKVCKAIAMAAEIRAIGCFCETKPRGDAFSATYDLALAKQSQTWHRKLVL